MATEVGSLYATFGLDTSDFDKKIPAATKQIGEFEKVLSGKVRHALTNLSFQINDIGTSLASGASPFQVLAQQGGQIVQAFQQGGGVVPVLKATATSIAGMITPARLAVGGLAAIGAGFGALVVRAERAQESARQFDILLKGLGQGSLTTGAGLEKVTQKMRAFGLSAAEAREAERGIIRSGLSGARSGDIIGTGKNAEVLLGGDGVQTVTTALSGGLETTIQLGVQLKALTAQEIAAWREMARLGQTTDATTQAFDKISGKVKGLDEQALTPLGRAMRELSVAWGRAMNAMASSTAMLKIVQFFTLVSKGIERVGGWLGGEDTGGKTTAEAGGGMTRDRALDLIEQYESDGRNIHQGLVGPKGGYNPSTGTVTGPSSAQGYYQITNSTWKAYAPGAGVDLSKYPNAMSAPRDVQRTVAGSIYDKRGFADWAPYNAALRGAIAGEGGGAGGAVKPEDTVAQQAALDEVIKQREKQIEVLKGVGAEQDVVRAKEEAATITSDKHLDAEQAARLEAQLINNVYRERQIEQNKLIQLTEQEISGVRDLTKAYGKGAFAGVQQESLTTAQKEAFQQLGTTGGSRYEKFVSTRSTQLTLLAQDSARQGFAKSNLTDRDTIEVNRLEASLAAETTDQIGRQVDLLKVKQQAQAIGVEDTDKEYQLRLKTVNALWDSVDALTAAKNQMSRFREIGTTLEGSLSTIFDTITDGTFKFRNALGTIFKDLGKLLTSQAFKALFYGAESGGVGGGLFGSLGKLLGIGGSGGSSLPGLVDKGGGIMDTAGFATGGSFSVGGSGAIDSKIVAFRATPGELVNVRKPGQSGGGGEVISINLNPSEGWVSGIADQQIRTHSGTIVRVAVAQSQSTTRRNFSTLARESGARQA